MPYTALNVNVEKDVFTQFKMNLLAKDATITDILSTFIEKVANDINLIDQFKSKGIENDRQNNV